MVGFYCVSLNELKDKMSCDCSLLAIHLLATFQLESRCILGKDSNEGYAPFQREMTKFLKCMYDWIIGINLTIDI